MSPDSERCWGVIPAAGISRRMASTLPKQYLPLQGLTVLEHSLKALLECQSIEAVMVALHPDDDRPATMECFAQSRVMQVIGGETRSDSVRAALRALAGVAELGDWVLVHDAARPCVAATEIVNLHGRVSTSGVGGILAEPIVDTVKQATEEARVLRTLDRTVLWRAQTPQMFRLGELQNALEDALVAGAVVTDEASAMELAGHPVQLVAGSSRNLKITLPEDLQLAAFYLESGLCA